MEAVHLTKVEDVEQTADADRVDRILGVNCDPLRVEVLLDDVAGQSRDDADHEDHDTDHPGLRSPVAPTGAPELAPEVQHHEDEEHLHRPEVDAVEEVSD